MRTLPDYLNWPKPDKRVSISRKAVGNTIAWAREEFEWCWRVILQMKGVTDTGPNVGVDIVRFQARLVAAIWRLEEVQRHVTKARKRITTNPGAFEADRRKRRVSQLSEYETALKECVETGRALGDGFAWFFYRRDRSLIAEHLKHQRNTTLPLGFGGLGERLLVSSNYGAKDQILIYHGTTSFLTIGDVSFVDLKTLRVKSIGEVKTARIGDSTLQTTVHILAVTKGDLPRIKSTGAKIAQATLRPEMQERLKQQQERMAAALRNATNQNGRSVGWGIAAGSYYAELTDVVRRSHPKSFEYVQAGQALLIGALRAPNGQTFGGLTRRKFDANAVIAGLSDQATKILIPGADDNAIGIGSPGSSKDLWVTETAVPPAWWPVDANVLHDILFGRVMLTTLYNPAHLLHAIENKGFEKRRRDSGIRFHRKLDNGKYLALDNMEYFDRLITTSFLSLESTVEIIMQGIDGLLAHHTEVADTTADFRGRVLPMIET